MSVSSPIEVQLADASYDFLPMPTIADKSGSTLSAEFWGERLDGVSGTLGFPRERRVSLVPITVAPVGDNRTLLSVDVYHIAGATLPPSRRMSSEPASAGRASLHHRTRSFVGKTCGQNPANNTTLQRHLGVALPAALRPPYRRLGSPSTIWPRRKEKTCF